MKGKHTGLSGAEYNYKATNVQPGRAPDTIWLALDDYNEGLALIALVGFDTHILKFARRAGQHPVSVLDMPDVPAGTPRLAVTLAGLWPNERARSIVEQLTGGGSHGWRQWAREYRKLRADPDRVQAGFPSADLTKELAQLFMQQCAQVTGSGRS